MVGRTLQDSDAVIAALQERADRHAARLVLSILQASAPAWISPVWQGKGEGTGYPACMKQGLERGGGAGRESGAKCTSTRRSPGSARSRRGRREPPPRRTCRSASTASPSPRWLRRGWRPAAPSPKGGTWNASEALRELGSRVHLRRRPRHLLAIGGRGEVGDRRPRSGCQPAASISRGGPRTETAAAAEARRPNTATAIYARRRDHRAVLSSLMAPASVACSMSCWLESSGTDLVCFLYRSEPSGV